MMRPKKNLLEEIGNTMDISVSGIDNFPHDAPVIIVANHTSMSDIFSVPHSLPTAAQIVLSSRLMWKNTTPEQKYRRQLIENSLYGIPLEVHGGKQRLEVGLSMARKAIQEMWPLIIFPEGAYTGKKEVTKGRTGAARLLFDTSTHNRPTQLLPVGINTTVTQDSIDSLQPTHPIQIVVGDPINTSDLYRHYQSTDDETERRDILHQTTKLAMRAVASTIKYPYIDEHIPVFPRTTIILESGEEVPLDDGTETNAGTPSVPRRTHYAIQPSYSD